MDTGDPDDIMFGVFSAPRRKRMGYANSDVDKLNTDAQVERNPGLVHRAEAISSTASTAASSFSLA
jgi:hypothetical protein